MSFLAPLFLLGGAAILGPIIFHLIRRTTREVTPFSTLMFLQPTPPRVTKRSRIENLWLLLLRCLALALLALAFARPFFVRPASSLPPAEGAGKRTVILLDTSASMRRGNLWPEAQSRAEAIARRAAPVDEISLLTFDRTARSIVSFEEWRKLEASNRAVTLGEHLKTLTPTWAGTRLDTALLAAADVLDQAAKDGPHPREVIVISDLQEGSRLDALQGYEWPRGLEVEFVALSAAPTANAAVQWLAEGDDAGPAADEDAPPRLRATNSADSRTEQFKLQWAGAALDAYVPAGQSRIVKPPKAPADRTLPLTISGDAVDFDNRVFLLPPQPFTLPILFAGPDADDDPHASLYYLRRAFPPTRRQRIEIKTHRTNDAVPEFQIQSAQLLVLGDTAPEAVTASARQFAERGHTVVVPLTSAGGAATLARLLGVPAVPVTEATVKDYALLAQIDFSHPLFAAFADPRFSDFTKIHFWKHRRLDLASLPGAQVLARFDGGDPALVQVPLGKGRALIFTSSWRPTDSQFALSSKFVPLLHAILDQSSNLPARRAQYFIGDEVALPAGAEEVVIRKPDSTEVKASGQFTATDLPGVYTLPASAERFVVNLAPEESRLAPLSPDRFTALGVPLRKSGAAATAKTDPQREAQAQAAEVENRQKLWRWLLAAALLVLLLETLIAGKLSRPAAVPQEATP